MLLIIVLTLLTAATSDELCYICSEHIVDDPTLSGPVRDASVLCTQETLTSCPAGTKCQASLMHAEVDIFGLGGDYKSLNSSCFPVDSSRNACQDEKDDIESSGGSITIYSCDTGVDVQSNRLLQEDEVNQRPTELFQCFDCFELDVGDLGDISGMSRPCNESITCAEGQYCNQIELEMRSELFPTANLKMKLGQCSPLMLTCEFAETMASNYDVMLDADMSITNCNDKADFFAENAEEVEKEQEEPVGPGKCFDCLEIDFNGLYIPSPSSNLESKCDQPVECLENELCNQIELGMTSDVDPSISLTMKFAQCSPVEMSCELIENIASEYQQTLNASITDCNDKADFFKNMNSEEGNGEEDGEEDEGEGGDDTFEFRGFESKKGGRFAMDLVINDSRVMKPKKWNAIRKSIKATACGENVNVNVRLYKKLAKAVVSGKLNKNRCSGCVEIFVGGNLIEAEYCN